MYRGCGVEYKTIHTMKHIRILTRAMVAALTLLSGAALAAPTTLTQSVTYNGETITMQLTRENLRGAHFELWAQNAAGTYDVITPVAERSYLGTVDEYPGAVSYGILQDDGVFKGGVIFDRGRTWYTLGSSVYNASGIAQPTSFGYTTETVSAGQGGSTVYGFDVGIDARYEYYNERGGGSVAKTLEVIELSLAGTRALYVHDALLRPYLGRVIVRTDQAQDPANGLTGGTYLDAVRNHWNNNHTDADRDVVAGVATSHVWAGLAWVNVIASGSAYSVNDSQGDGNFFNVWRHELGHNWGLGHYDGGAPEAGTINSNNHFARVSGPELWKMLNQRNAKLWAMDDEGSLATVNIPPYASYDSRVFTQGVDTQLTIDVLANDHDANGHTLTLTGVQSTTAQGGTATVQNGQIVYTPNGNFLGVDSFTYTVQDSSGQVATGAVAIDVRRDDRLRLYLALDETTGTTAGDSSVFSDNGTLSGTDFDTSSVAGRFGNAVDLDGIDDHLTTSWVTLQSNTVTLAAWIKRGATTNAWSGIIFDRTYSASGFGFGSGGELRYHWNDGQWSWNSGLVPAAGTWTFVALVVEPGKATMYMNDGSGFQSAVNNTSHAAAAFGNVAIGHDPAQSSRHFLGAIDEARIYNEALSQTELQSVMDGGSAEGPTPFDGASDVGPTDLAWVPSASAIQYHVYLGSDETAVQNATTASPEYLGAVASTGFVDPPTTVLATNYWRVDTETANGTITGPVWQFTRNDLKKISIANHSFEDDPTGTGTPSGWTLTAGSGSNLGSGTGGSDGSQFLWIGTGLQIMQDLGHTLVAGENLTLTYTSSRTYPRNIQLLAENGGIYQLIAETTEATGSAGWPTITLNHTVGSQYAGQQLALRIISGNWNEFDNFQLTTAGGSSNQAPVFNSDPMSAANATEGTAYTDSIAGSASDADSDPLSYSKVSGPAWLGVASNGDLTGTPTANDIGVNAFTVQVDDGNGGTDTATLNITVRSFLGTMLSDDFERAAGTTIGGGWIEQSNDSRIYDTQQPATKMLISLTAGTPFAVVNQLGQTYKSGDRYELLWNGSRAASANGTLVYDVSIGTWDGSTFTPLASQAGSISNVNLFGKVAGPAVYATATAAEAGQQIAVRFEVVSGSSDWAGFDDIVINALGPNTAPVANDGSGSVAEDATIGTSVVNVSASDADTGDTLSYAITGGNTGGAFAIDNTGAITTATALDFETTPSYSLTVTVTDTGSLSDTATVSITVTDVAEVTAPAVATGAASNITQTSADIAYTVTDDGGEAPTATIYYGETDGGTTPGNWDSSAGQGAKATGGHSAALSGLTAGTTYYFTVHASNSAGEAWGSTGSFTTEADTSPKLVRTTVSSVSSSSWTAVDLGQVYNSAVIIATPIYPNSLVAPVVTRIRNVSGSGFEVKIDRADGLTGAVTCDVSIIALEEGVYTQAADGVTMEAVKFSSSTTSYKNGWTAEARSYQNSYTSPVVVGQVMSANDANWSTFWCQGSSRTSPPNASNLNVGKHVGEDPNTTRAAETIGYIVIEAGNGTINGVAYNAGLGSDTVRGTGNTSVGYNYSLTGLSSASAAAASLAGLDGGDGGWAVLYGVTPLSASTITLAVDEDQLSNSERKHTTEQCGYIVFE